MKLQDLLRHVADNVEAGLNCGTGLLYEGEKPASAFVKHIQLTFSHHDRYALAPKTHTVNGFEVPAPMEAEPAHAETYFTIGLSLFTLSMKNAWLADHTDFKALSRKICFHTFQDAQQNAKAMLGIHPDTPIEEC